MATYYIDPHTGHSGDGLSPETAASDQSGLSIASGDMVLYRRGSLVRGMLPTAGGVYYGAYGEGEKPTFCGSVDVSDPSLWEEIEPHIWRCLAELPSDAGNFVFGEGSERVGATLRWERGELAAQGDFWDSCFGNNTYRRGEAVRGDHELTLVWSEKNPGDYYSHIECCTYGTRVMAWLKSGMVLEGLRFINSGVHGTAGAGENITVRGCDYEFIGGAAWSVELRIRFGNCIELWNYATDVTVENCRFYQTYDSCVTHQGGREVEPAVRFICRGNLFDTYGMAAFEYRDRMTVDSVFENNICLNAGCGFAMLGEVLPRKSEIWPQPMGHHIFLWRIEAPSAGGSLAIKDNIFGDAPVGAAIYSIISPDAEAQMTVDHNRYFTTNKVLLNRFDGENFADFEAFRKASGCETNGVFGEFDADALVGEWMKKNR